MIGFYFCQMIFYNLIDIKQHSTKEIDNFNNLLRVDYRCNKISEFVDRLLPRHIQETILLGTKLVDTYDDVTLLFADIVGFTDYSTGKSAR